MSLERFQYEAVKENLLQLLGCRGSVVSADGILGELFDLLAPRTKACRSILKLYAYLDRADLSYRQKRDFLLVAELIASYTDQVPGAVIYHYLRDYFIGGIPLLSEPERLEDYIASFRESLRFPPSSYSDISSAPP